MTTPTWRQSLKTLATYRWRCIWRVATCLRLAWVRRISSRSSDRRNLCSMLPFTGGEAGWLPTEQERHVGRTFQLSFGRLRPDDPTDGVALRLLARSACLA